MIPIHCGPDHRVDHQMATRDVGFRFLGGKGMLGKEKTRKPLSLASDVLFVEPDARSQSTASKCNGTRRPVHSVDG
jgi:hypothetical protein